MPGNELIGHEELGQIQEVFSSGGVLFGHGFEARRKGCYKVREFEDKLTEKFECYAAVCSSGTAALFVSLKILGVARDDYVAIQHYNFVACAEAVLACNAIPIVINVNSSLTMCPKDLDAKFKRYNFKVVIATDMQGNPAEFNSLKALCEANRSFLVEDACQAIGGKYMKRYLGTVADIGTFSLDFGKTITTGEGGVVFNRDKDLHELAKAFIDHGHRNEPGVDRGNDRAVICGFNFRMSELQAAVGIAQLAKLDKIVSHYTENLNSLYDSVYKSIKDDVDFRVLNDVDYLHDALIFFLRTGRTVSEVSEIAATLSLPFKNVPNAIRWHSAHHWGHLWDDHPVYSDPSGRDWNASNRLLASAVSFSVNVLDTKTDLRERADRIIEFVRRTSL